MSRTSIRVFTSWILVLTGAAVALLIAWLSHVVSIPVTALLAVSAVVLSLSWLIVLATVPWNLYFAARRAAAEMVVSRERGIEVRPAYDEEAGQISSRMLRFAIGAHAGTALVAAAIAYLSGNKIGYYIAGIFLISTGFRPAAAYFVHVRERIKVLSRETTYPRDDVATLQEKVDTLEQDIEQLQALVASQEAGRSRSDDLDRKIDHLLGYLQAGLDQPAGHGIRVLQQRRDEAQGALATAQREPTAPACLDLLEAGSAVDRRLRRSGPTTTRRLSTLQPAPETRRRTRSPRSRAGT